MNDAIRPPAGYGPRRPGACAPYSGNTGSATAKKMLLS